MVKLYKNEKGQIKVVGAVQLVNEDGTAVRHPSKFSSVCGRTNHFM